MKKIELCPLCGSKGDDLLFKFYCSNKKCQNFQKIEIQNNLIKQEDELGFDGWADYYYYLNGI